MNLVSGNLVKVGDTGIGDTGQSDALDVLEPALFRGTAEFSVELHILRGGDDLEEGRNRSEPEP